MITAVLVGAGNRGKDAYGAWALAHRDQLKFVAVAEPSAERRNLFAGAQGILPERSFANWDELLPWANWPIFASSPPRTAKHTEPTLAALDLGYHLAGKPMAVTEQDCRLLVTASERAGRQLRVAHVLHTRFFSTIKAALAGAVR